MQQQRLKTRKTRLALLIAALALVGATSAVAAQFSKQQTISYSLTPTLNATVQTLALGNLAGGASGTQTFSGALTISMTNPASHGVTATLSVPSTDFYSFELAITNSGGQQCDLKGGSGVSQTTTCNWNISGNVSYDEVVLYKTLDGVSDSSGAVTVSFVVA